MDALLLYNQYSNGITEFILIYTRILFFLITCLIFRREYVSTRIVVALTAVLALYQLSIAPQNVMATSIDYIGMLFIGVQQALIGFVIGVSVNLLFDVFMGLGQFTSTQIGLSIANQFDPRFGMVTPLSRFYVLLAMVLFFGMNGHLILIDLVMSSFNAIPVNKAINFIAFKDLVKYASIIFMGAVSLSLTLLIVIMLTNITLAIMTKFAPQINLFSVGLNLALLIGFVCIYLSYSYIVSYGSSIMTDVLRYTKSFMGAMG